MKDREFDELVKKRLQNHESAVPTGMWQRIAGKEKKRRPVFLWYLLLVIFLPGAYAIYYFNHHAKIESTVVSPTEEKRTAGDNQQQGLETRESQNESTTVSKNKPGNYAKDKTSLPSASDVPASTLDKLAGKTSAKTPPISNDLSRQKLEQVKTKKKTVAKKSKQAGHVILSSTPSTPAIANDDRAEMTMKPPQSTNRTTDSIAKKKVAEKNGNKPDSALASGTNPVESVDDKFALELYMAPEIAMNSITAADKSYQQALKRAGTVQLSYSAGASVSYAFTRKLFAKIGVQYTKLNEKVSFKDQLGTGFNSNNHYTIISVPLLVGYKMANNDDLKFYVNAGTVVNIVSIYQGIIPSISGQAIDLKTNNVYDKNVSTSLYFSLDVSRKLNRRTDVFAEPWLIYQVKNMVSHYYSFDRRMHSMGLALGFRYRLFRNTDHQF